MIDVMIMIVINISISTNIAKKVLIIINGGRNISLNLYLFTNKIAGLKPAYFLLIPKRCDFLGVFALNETSVFACKNEYSFAKRPTLSAKNPPNAK